MFPHDYSWKLMIRGREGPSVLDANDLTRMVCNVSKNTKLVLEINQC